MFCRWNESKLAKSSVTCAILTLYCVSLVCALPYSRNSNVTELDPRSFEKQVLGSPENWLIEFYAPWCGYCKQLEPIYEKVASKLKDAVRVGAVNADKYPELAQRYQVRGFPSIFLFHLSNKKNKIPVEYQGDRTSKSLLAFVEERIPSFVAQVKASGIEAFLRNDPELVHVLLATNKRTPSLLLKALSATYAGTIVFGIIHKDDLDAHAMKLYGIHKYPVLLGFSANSSKTTSQPQTFYLEHAQRKDIHEFLRQLLNSSSFASSKEHTVNLSNIFQVDNWTQVEQNCVVSHKGKICNLFIFCSRDDLDWFSRENLTSRYRDSIFQFFAIDWKLCPKQWLEQFGINSSICSEPSLIAWKTKSMKYAKCFNATDTFQVENFMDRLVGGDITFHKLSIEQPSSIHDEV